MRNYGYALAAADLMKDIGRTNAMREFGRVQAYAPLAESIPAGLSQVMQNRDARGVQAQNQQLRDLQMRTAQRAEQQQIGEFGRETAIRDLFSLVPRNPDGTQNLQGIANEAMVVDPTSGMQIQGWADQQTQRAAEVTREKALTVARVLGEAKDDNSWKAAIGRLEQSGIKSPPGTPMTYDPVFQRQLVDGALSNAQWLASKLAKPEMPATETMEILNPDGSTTQEIVPKIPGIRRTGAPPVKQPKITWEPRLLDGKRAEVGIDEQGRYYLPGDTKTAINPSRVRLVPEKTTGDAGITPAMKAQAERMKGERFIALEREYATRNAPPAADPTLPPSNPMTAEELESRKATIQRSYEAEVGITPAAKPAAAPIRTAPLVAVTPTAPAPARQKYYVPDPQGGADFEFDTKEAADVAQRRFNALKPARKPATTSANRPQR